MNSACSAHFVVGGIGSLYGDAFPFRGGGMAVYQLLGITKVIPPVTPHDKSLHAQFEALAKALVKALK